MHDPLVPRAALPYLEVHLPTGRHHAELAPVRREALDVLTAGYRSPVRLLLGLLAWSAVLGGTLLLAFATGVAWTVAGAGLVSAGVALAVAVLRAGRRLTRAAAQWLQVPAVGASGRDAGPLYGVVRGRAALALLSACLAVVLLVLLGTLASGTGDPVSAVLGSRASATGGAAGPGVLAALAVGAGASAVAAVASFVGIRRILLAAWLRPTVAPSDRPVQPGGGSAEVAGRGEPPTVELDLAVRPVDAGRPYPATQPPGPPQDVHREVAHPAAVEVVLSTGQPLQPGVTILGRSPAARPEDVVDHILVLTDQTVTKTHATITVERDRVTVVDRASTNGTLLERPDGSLLRCRPWQVTTVPSPAIIHLGHTRLLVRPLPAHRPLEVA